MLGIELEYTTKYAISRKYGTLVSLTGNPDYDVKWNAVSSEHRDCLAATVLGVMRNVDYEHP